MVSTRSRLRHLIEARLESVDSLDAVASAVFEVVGAEIPNVLTCLATMDPSSGLITRALKSKPLEIGDHEFTAAEYGAPDVNRFDDLARRPVPVGVLSVDTAGSPSSCLRFREFMAPRFGFTDELRLACLTGGTMWGALALYRGEGEASFTREDGARAAEIHELVARALMRTLVAPERVPDPQRPPAVLVLDESDRIESRSGPTDALIDVLGGWDAGDLPASMLAVAAAARTAAGTASSRIRTLDGEWVTARAVAVTTLSGVRSVVLTVETPHPAAIGRLRLAARGLTTREKDIVQQVLLGASTKEIALELHLSAHTVQDHLKAVFAKLGISSRRELIAQFVG
ncbi:helix-turn-helix transcriptional regulator [Amnibacterium endophyticum]|uniref:Response regulator transcription factor n=1 Tax=Amnibacterium endophyticum TaxID=2109337 RepID=A0ABW4LDM5_9MICO